jgi:hypothetical protein
MDIDSVRKKVFPLKLSNGYSVEAATKESVYEFLSANISKVFPGRDSATNFQRPESRRAAFKELHAHYLQLHHEWFLFKLNGETVGWFMGETEDFSTFYMRNTGILPEHQNKGIYGEFAKHFFSYLVQLGYERISSQHMVTNQKILISKLKMGFIICNLELTEDWGPMVKLVKFLFEDRRDFFIKSFGDQGHRELFD